MTKHVEFFPSEYFEKQIGMKIGTISKRWKMPLSYSEHEMAEWLLGKQKTTRTSRNLRLCRPAGIARYKRFQMLYEMLLKLNPSLPQTTNPDLVGFIVWGALSRFNAVDIDFFTHKGGLEKRSKRYLNRLNQLILLAENPIEWVPHELTLNKIERALGSRKNPTTPAFIILYHYTSPHRLSEILESSLSRGDVPLAEGLSMDKSPTAVWFTDMPTAGSNHDNGLNDAKRIVRIAVQFPKNDPKLIKWRLYASKKFVSQKWYDKLNRYGGGLADHWWLYLGSIDLINGPYPTQIDFLHEGIYKP